MFFSRSLFDILKAYTQSVGDINQYSAQQAALRDTTALAHFAREKVGVELDDSLTQEISEAGLRLIDNIQKNPEQAEQYWDDAKHTLDD